MGQFVQAIKGISQAVKELNMQLFQVTLVYIMKQMAYQ